LSSVLKRYASFKGKRIPIFPDAIYSAKLYDIQYIQDKKCDVKMLIERKTFYLHFFVIPAKLLIYSHPEQSMVELLVI